MWLNIGLSRKIRKKCVFWLFLKIGLCSATSFKSSRQECSIDMAEHRSILKNNQNTYCPRCSFTLKTGTELPEKGVLILLCQRGAMSKNSKRKNNIGGVILRKLFEKALRV